MKKAAGRPVVMVPLILYSDDTSGNKSKKWHLFNSWSVLLAGLPRETNSQLTNIHFLSWSDKVSVLEMAEPITNELVHLEREGTEVYDAHLQCNFLVVARVLCAICDNPSASEMVNHMKGAAIKFCRICNVRNQHLNTNSLLYYDLSMTIYVDKNTVPPTLGPLRSSGSSLRQILEIRSQSTEAAKRSLRKKYGLNDVHNPLLTLPVDLYQ